jgi:hypothetical protein
LEKYDFENDEKFEKMHFWPRNMRQNAKTRADSCFSAKITPRECVSTDLDVKTPSRRRDDGLRRDGVMSRAPRSSRRKFVVTPS